MLKVHHYLGISFLWKEKRARELMEACDVICYIWLTLAYYSVSSEKVAAMCDSYRDGEVND